MKTAEELRKIAEEEAPNYIKKLLPPKERISEICESSAHSGLKTCTYSFRIRRDFPEYVLSDYCVNYVREFEENGYLVEIRVLEDTEQYNKIKITFSWDSELPFYEDDEEVIYREIGEKTAWL